MGPNSIERNNSASQRAWMHTMKKRDITSKIMSQKEIQRERKKIKIKRK